MLQGRHPRHRGVKDLAVLGPGEQFQAAILDIPALKARMDAMVFAQSFESDLNLVSWHVNGVWKKPFEFF